MKKRRPPPKGYRSKFEKAVADELKALKVNYGYESIKVPYTLSRQYVSDFSFGDLLLEVKGYLRRTDISKMLAVKKQNPNVRIVFLFMAPNKPMIGSKTTHAEWAEKNGFEWTTITNLSELISNEKLQKRLEK